MKRLLTMALALSATACMTKIERIEAPAQQGPTAQGTETHGGDVLRARALEFRDLLTLSQMELDHGSVGPAHGSRREFKPMLSDVWRGAAIAVQRLVPSQLEEDLLLLTQDLGAGTILNDIEKSTLEVKVYPPATDPDSKDPKYGNCVDYHGKEATAGAKLGDRGGSICVDAKKLAQEAPNELELLGIASHELAHHFGIEEDRAIAIQKYVTANAAALKEWGAFGRQQNVLSIDTAKTADRVLTFRLKVMEKWNVNFMPLNCKGTLDCASFVQDRFEGREDRAAVAVGKTSGMAYELVLSPGYYEAGTRVTLFPLKWIADLKSPDHFLVAYEIVEGDGSVSEEGVLTFDGQLPEIYFWFK